MKRFIRDIVIFVVVLLILFGGAEWVAESIPNSYTYKRDYMELYGEEIKTLILGSSNAYDGLNPCVLPNAFNLANSSQTLEDDYRLLAKYIDSMDSLRTVIVGLGFHSLAATPEANRRMYYTIYMDLYSRWILSRYSLEFFDLQALTKKIMQYVVSRDVTRCDTLGQRIGHTLEAAQSGAEWWNKDVLSLVENDKLEIGNCRLEIEDNLRYMHAIVDLCNAHGVQPVIVQMPVTREYKQYLPAQQITFHDSVMRSLPSLAIYLDASEWSIPEDGWYNATHLTKEASVGFTHQLMDSIQSR